MPSIAGQENPEQLGSKNFKIREFKYVKSDGGIYYEHTGQFFLKWKSCRDYRWCRPIWQTNAKDMTQYGKIVSHTLKKLKAEGLIDKVGVSVYHPEEVEEMLKDNLYEAVQIPMNLFDQRMKSKGIIQKLKDKNIIVFVRSVFLQGLFFLDPENLPKKVQIAKEPLLLLRELAEKENMNIAQLAIAYVRDVEGVSSLVLGVETPEQITENIRLMDTPAISEKTRHEIETVFKNVPILEIMEGLR